MDMKFLIVAVMVSCLHFQINIILKILEGSQETDYEKQNPQPSETDLGLLQHPSWGAS